MSVEARDTILYGQLQDGLRVVLMKSPSVSGAMSYKELCMTAHNEGQQAELRKYRNYRKMGSTYQHAKKYYNGNSEGLDLSRPKPVYSCI